jgi:hypothetical protein
MKIPDFDYVVKLFMGDIIEQLCYKPQNAQQAKMMIAAIDAVRQRLIEKFNLQQEFNKDENKY